jgi:anion-transporting  ArsA/GET3 family ATPase
LLAEVVRKSFPVPLLAKSVLNSRIYQNLVEVAPGLKEFYFLLRLQSLAERKEPAGGEVLNYDLLLWDAPATGHFLGTLRSAKSFEMYLTGPLASAGAEVARFFSNTASISVLPTTTLEEMAIDETSEMCRSLNNEFKLQATAVLLNLVSPLTSAGEPEVEEVSRASRSSSDSALHFATERGLIERERAAGLRAAIPAPAVPVQRIRRWTTDIDLLDQVGRYLETLPVAV